MTRGNTQYERLLGPSGAESTAARSEGSYRSGEDLCFASSVPLPPIHHVSFALPPPPALQLRAASAGAPGQGTPRDSNEEQVEATSSCLADVAVGEGTGFFRM